MSFDTIKAADELTTRLFRGKGNVALAIWDMEMVHATLVEALHFAYTAGFKESQNVENRSTTKPRPMQILEDKPPRDTSGSS